MQQRPKHASLAIVVVNLVGHSIPGSGVVLRLLHLGQPVPFGLQLDGEVGEGEELLLRQLDHRRRSEFGTEQDESRPLGGSARGGTGNVAAIFGRRRLAENTTASHGLSEFSSSVLDSRNESVNIGSGGGTFYIRVVRIWLGLSTCGAIRFGKAL